MFNEEYKSGIKNNSNASMFARDSYSSKLVTNDSLFNSTGTYKPFESKYAFNPDLDTSEGLFKLAQQAGLGDDAKRVVQKVGGENQKFFSGGFVMDAMDVLNISSYGMVGLLKGKSFAEGVKNRETFADDDALGKFGWTGKVAGFILDIAVDPLTYVAPWKLITKVPGVVKGLDKATTAVLGELQMINVGEKVIPTGRVGGWSPLTYLSNKLVYGFSMDKNTLEGIQSRIDAGATAQAEVEQMISIFSAIEPKLADKALHFKETGELARKPLAELQRDFSPEDMAKIEPIYKAIDANADKLVELGVISKAARDKHVDDYVQMMYDDYLLAKRQKPTGKAGVGLNVKSRVEGLTKEQRKEMGIVENSSVVFGATLLKQVELIKRAELQNYLSKNIGLSADDMVKYGVDATKFTKVSETPAYMVNKGKDIDFRIQLKDVNKAFKPALKELRKAFDGNKEMLTQIKRLEKELDDLPKLGQEAYRDAISDIKKLLNEGGVRVENPKEIISEGQKSLAASLRKWLDKGSRTTRLEREAMDSDDLLREFLQTREGLALERAFDDPQMMYNFTSMKQFFDNVRYPGVKRVKNVEPSEITDPKAIARMQERKLKEAESYARRFGEISAVVPHLKNTKLKDAQRALAKADAKLADLHFQKEKLLDGMSDNSMGNLAGKYLPKEIWEMVKGTFEPKAEFGEPAVLWFKHAKVIWNPAAYPRNMMSAMIQNWWKTGLGPWRVDVYLDARNEINTAGKYFQRMKKLGFHENTGAVNELTDNYIQSKLIGDAIQASTGAPKAKVVAQLKHWDRWAKNSYGHIDNIAKVAAFKNAVKKGMSDEDAMRAAYVATFNYSHVTPFVNQMRRAMWGVPFITFNLKAVPLVIDTLKNAPQRISVFGKARNSLFQAAGIEAEQETEAMPDWMRDSAFMMRLPWKDSEGRSMYFDMSYIIPFGAIMNGEYAREPIATNPLLQTVKELSQNKSFSGTKIFNESDDRDTVIADIFVHVSKLSLPPVVAEQLPKGYSDNGERIYGTFPRSFIEEDLGPGTRTFYQEMFRLTGLGVSPYELESKERTFDYRRKQALQQLLVQNDVLGEFTNPYIPKEDEKAIPNLLNREVKPIGR